MHHTYRLAQDYEEVVDDSRSAAAKLSAIINSETLRYGHFRFYYGS